MDSVLKTAPHMLGKEVLDSARVKVKRLGLFLKVLKDRRRFMEMGQICNRVFYIR